MIPAKLPGDLGILHGAMPLAGGSICDVWAGHLDGGLEVVVKRAPYDPAIEVEGLQALAAAGAPVPEVLGWDDRVLVLRRVGGSPDWLGLGRAVAALHRGRGDGRFGWRSDNLLGRWRQPGGWSDDWAAFFAERRVRPLLGAPALPAVVRGRLERALEGSLQRLLGAHGPRPSLVHGDLWSGNIVAGRWLIDPAVWWADRELELAFAKLFGGLPDAFYAAYEAEWPLPAGAAARRPALQLYHLLIHVAHFGAGYVSPVADRLDQLGWR